MPTTVPRPRMINLISPGPEKAKSGSDLVPIDLVPLSAERKNPSTCMALTNTLEGFSRSRSRSSVRFGRSKSPNLSGIVPIGMVGRMGGLVGKRSGMTGTTPGTLLLLGSAMTCAQIAIEPAPVGIVTVTSSPSVMEKGGKTWLSFICHTASSRNCRRLNSAAFTSAFSSTKGINGSANAG